MHLTKVTLKNYGVYRDKVEFDLTTTPDKPVILIGGTNGAGKTTLFESILVGFYGQSYFDKKTTRKEYEKFLGNKVHRYLGTTAAADSTSIVIDFKFYHNGIVDDYTVDRTWYNDDGRLTEQLKIKKNNKRLDSVEESQWQSFIEELIPKGIAKLFFFDGEKIVKMTEDDNEEIEIKSSFDSLLGLDIVEQLHSDLRTHIMRNMKGNSNSINAQYDSLIQEKQEIVDELNDLKDSEGKVMRKGLDTLLREEKTTLGEIADGKFDDSGKPILGINEIEAKISKIGGGFASKREDLRVEQTSLQTTKTYLTNELKSLLSGEMPFCLIPKQIKSLETQIKKDSEITKKQFEKEILDEKLNQILAVLDQKTLWKGVADESKIKDSLNSKIIKVFDSKKSLTKDMKNLFNFSLFESTNILNLLENLTLDISKLDKDSKQFDAISDKLNQIETALSNAPNDDEIAPLMSKLKILNENQADSKTKISSIEKKITTQNTYLKMINSKIRNIVADQYKDKNAGIQAQLATKVQKVLDEYILKLKEKKLQLLEVYLLEELQRLLHKENLITKITIDKESFEITLYDKDENAIPKDLLSKGEQQMFATGVLLALAKTSGKPLPFMIDTPLARLDVSHRDNMIEKFFPYASHQVVIFSTDSEISQDYYQQLLPYLSRSYAMEYLPGKGKTRQHLGYFWNEKGERIIAV
ncbi:MAG: DNA sulfur modification protein DndD [Candidatus Nitrosopelagicus sp.]|jgi:DNA sulfur modification protein DndD|nr:DNA sulfur modification protein DndD [Candidatus Nitrosopelagicus sp.]